MRGRNSLSEFECIINGVCGCEGTAKMLLCSSLPCMCLCVSLCVGEELPSGAAAVLWLGTSLLEEQA